MVARLCALVKPPADPSIHEDCLELLREQLPLTRRYRHSYEGAENAVAHLAGMMVFGDSTWAPVRNGKLDLGTWQRLFLVELFEPRRRTVDVAVFGESGGLSRPSPPHPSPARAGEGRLISGRAKGVERGVRELFEPRERTVDVAVLGE